MLFQSTLLPLLLAALSPIALALPSSESALVERASTGTVNVVNKLSSSINYALVGESGVVSKGTIQPGKTKNLPMSPDGKGYSTKLAPAGKDPMASQGILQFEYTFKSSGTPSNSVFFDWSAVNGNPDPFKAYKRTIQPSRPSSSCRAITCNAGQSDSSCEFVTPTSGPVVACPVFNGVVLTATIG